jgi:hypothetical protein
MDILKMLAELRAEREQIEEAMVALERLARGQGKRRGRPPKWMSGAAGTPAEAGAPRRKRVVSPEARARMAAAQRKRWAAKRAEAKGS